MKTKKSRKVDTLGRVVLPSEMREYLNIAENDLLDMEVCDGAIVIKKHSPSCLLCGAEKNLKQFNEHYLFCEFCINEIKNL